ncbi:MAG: histidine--tRNA ligase [Planctomycetes bacterium]|nr:histidine--tRNA ligase [Planctomycetota bacterium]
MPSFQPLPGFVDLLPEDAARMRHLEETARTLFERCGYREIRPPLVEDAALFERTSGATSDIVQKQMFSIPSRDDAGAFVLRPEGTPGVFRAYLEAGYAKTNPFQKFFYLGPMFRYERPQKGRQRQFHQIGIEAIGSPDPHLDAEIVYLGYRFYEAVGLRQVTVLLNSIGCAACRPAYLQTLRNALTASLDTLCALCRDRFGRNVLRILDCKNAPCTQAVAQAPRIADSLCDDCRSHDRAFRIALKAGLPISEAPRLVRGLDYYTRTVFEYHHPGLGARSAVGAGGRYDGLGERLGGSAIPAVGFAIGVEATLLALEAEGKLPEPGGAGGIFVVYVDRDCRTDAYRLTEGLRNAGVTADLDHMGRSLKSQMKAADARGAHEIWILGPDEISAGTVKIKRLSDGSEKTLPVVEAISHASRAPADAPR